MLVLSPPADAHAEELRYLTNKLNQEHLDHRMFCTFTKT